MNQTNQELINSLQTLLPSCGKTIVISIDGPAGSGKTTLAQEIADRLDEVKVIHMDDLYRGWENTLTHDLSDLLVEILKCLENEEQVRFNPFDWSSGMLGPVVKFPAPKYLILEGVGSGQSAIRQKIATLIWIEVPIRIGLERVLDRDGLEIAPYMDEFIRTQSRHFEEEDTKKRADYHLSGLSIN
jgi:uridine kinase